MSPTDLPRSGQRARVVLSVLFAGALATAAAAFVLVRTDEPARVPPVISIEEAGLRFTYHVPTGAAGLYDVRGDPDATRNVIRERRDDADRLRRRLSERHGVDDVQDLRVQYRHEIDALRGLGYL